MSHISRRRILAASLAAGAGSPLALPGPVAAQYGRRRGGRRRGAMQQFHVYVGTYTGEKSKGIYRFQLDTVTGACTATTLAAEVPSPSFLAVHPAGPFLYAVGEVGQFRGPNAGAVYSFRVEPRTGALTPLNDESSRGAGPCHLVVDRTGKNVLVANYGGGSVACLPLEADGRLRPASSFVQHTGSSVNPQRQEAPHAHSINVSPDNRFVFVADLGLDQVLVYRFHAERGELTPHHPPFAAVTPGAGPRHFTFLPGGRYAFVINELGNTLTAFRYDERRGVLETIQEVSTLPEDFRGTSHTAEVVAHPSGRFVYGSNRGHDSIAIFRVERATGRLTPLGHQPTGGKTPRNFAIDPTGTFLLAANQASDNIHLFRIDPDSGLLRPTGTVVEAPFPVCVRFVPIAL